MWSLSAICIRYIPLGITAPSAIWVGNRQSKASSVAYRAMIVVLVSMRQLGVILGLLMGWLQWFERCYSKIRLVTALCRALRGIASKLARLLCVLKEWQSRGEQFWASCACSIN